MEHSGNSVCGFYENPFKKEKKPSEEQLYFELWQKSVDKIKNIKNSKSIVYNVFFGESQREKDLEFAEQVEARIYDYLKNKYKFKTIEQLCD
jgi:hypothetical protein